MLLLKRLLTTAALFVVLYILIVVFATVTMAVIAGIWAGCALARNFQSGYATYEAGFGMFPKYVPIIMLGSIIVSAITSSALSFSGAFPWCRSKMALPPSLEI